MELNVNYEKSLNKLFVSGGGIRREISAVAANLNRFNKIYIKHVSYGCFVHRMKDYIELAMRLMEDENYGRKAEFVRTQIGFPKDYNYCMLTAFHDHNMDVDLLFESTFFLQKIRPDDGYSLDALKGQLTHYLKQYESHVSEISLVTKRDVKPLPQNGSEDLLTSLQNLKTAITDQANLYCTNWKPFVYASFNTKTDSDDVQGYSLFVRHLFQNELCSITMSPYPIYDSIHTNSMIYTEWKCDGILESEEYGFQKYKEDVTKFEEEAKIQTVKSESGFSKAKSYACKLFAKPSAAANEVIQSDRSDVPPSHCKYELSLAEVKRDLKSNNIHYINAVIYYNIASAVMIYASIKEGQKMFKGITHVVQKSCGERNEIALDVQRELKYRLFAFKHFFDQIIFLTSEENRIPGIISVYGIMFNSRVERFMELLDGQDNNDNSVDGRQQICGEFSKIFDTINWDYKPHLGDLPDPVKFDGFYFTEPVLNVAELYRFARNIFL